MTSARAGRPEYFAALRPDGVCLVEDGRAVTWSAWNDAADRLAAGLAARGIHKGDKVGVRTQTCIEWFIINLALAKLGALHVALNWRLTPEELSHILDDSGATALIFDDEDVSALADAVKRMDLALLVALGDDVPSGVERFSTLLAAEIQEPYVSYSDAPLIIYTSGTTGRPKGAAPDLEKLANPSTELKEYQADIISGRGRKQDEARRPPAALLTMPLHHAAGPFAARSCLAKGGAVYILRRFDAEKALRIISEHRVTSWSAVPTMLHRLSALPADVLARYDVSSLRTVSVGAAPVSFALKDWAIEFFGEGVVHEGYGTTETGMIAGMQPEDQRRKPGSCGRPFRHVKVKIVDEQGVELPPGETGEILVITPIMISGYLNKGPLGPDRLGADGYYRTGDMGFVDTDGFLYVTDRKTDMIISGGVNIYPAEIEFALAKHPAVVEAAVIGVPHDEYGEQVLAFCELKHGAVTSCDDIFAFCKARLASHKLPQTIEFIEELPRNPMGKVLKTELRAPYWQGKERRI